MSKASVVRDLRAQSGAGGVTFGDAIRVARWALTIQFESHRNELPAIFELEHDQDVIEYYDQPSPITIEYEGKSKRRIRVLHTPDFFVIRLSAAGWEECKTEEDLLSLSVRNPNRY